MDKYLNNRATETFDRQEREFQQAAANSELDGNLVNTFRDIIFTYYRQFGRKLPWRDTGNPYYIFVSELMLQQTQVSRAQSKYPQFIEKFPDFVTLADSKFKDVLSAWQGLGYNRRALMLHRSAQQINCDYGGKLPQDVKELLKLPGIGYSTACEIAAFAFNKPVAFVETNIRTVYIHFFFQEKNNINDKELLPLVEKTLVRNDPRHWYYALMDYGEMLKRRYPNPGRKSAHYQKQGAFKGSGREIRGLILKKLTDSNGLTEASLIRLIDKESGRIRMNLENLQKEGFIEHNGRLYLIS